MVERIRPTLPMWRRDDLQFVGMDGITAEQEIWRFIPKLYLRDPLLSSKLYLRRISELRHADPRESRLPTVLEETLLQLHQPPQLQAFIREMLATIEDQATRVWASCWSMPPLTPPQEIRMWELYGGGSLGGIRISTTIQDLVSALPVGSGFSFGIGRVLYYSEALTFLEAFELNEYRSLPFLLKLAATPSQHEDDKEIRLFRRYQGHPDAAPGIFTRFCPFVPRAIMLSPLCSREIREAIYQELAAIELWRNILNSGN